MAITDIISEEEISTPNMEIAQGGPEDFMTEDEMDPYQDPELQQLLDSLPGEQAEVLMQLIKEFKAMVAQGFTGEFEDFVKMKMSTAQGGPEEDFMSEEEMIVPDEELQSMVPMGQQVAQGGRIGYQNAGPVGGIVDVVEEEQVERGPTTQQLIMKWLNDRGLPITPENIQRAIMEMSREGQAPAMPREQSLRPQMEMPRPPTGEGYVPEELIGQDITEVVTPQGIASMDVVTEEPEIMQKDDPVLYDDDEQTRWVEKGERLKSVKGGVSPDSYIWMMDNWAQEGRQKGWIPEDDYLNYQKRFLGEGGEQLTDRIDKYREDSGLNFAQGGRIGYQYGNQVTADAPGIMSQVSPSQTEQIQQSQAYEEAMQKIMNKFYEKFPGIDGSGMRIEDMVAELQAEGVWQHARNPQTGEVDILSFAAGLDMITPESVRKSTQKIMGGDTQWGDMSSEDEFYHPEYEHQFDHPVDVMRGRPGYGLGSLVKSVFKGVKKGVKGLTKSIKKFAKSDLGKMALMYMATAGMGNIGANWGGAKNWGTMFGKQGWLSPTNVMGNLGKSYSNLFSKAPAVTEASKAVTGVYPPGTSSTLPALYQKTKAPATLGSKILGSFGKNPMPWILGTSGLAGLYTKMNPGETNLDNLMGNYKGEVKEWDDMLADIRAGQGVTPFATDNVLFPYPNYYQLAGGGRVAAQEGGLMDLGGLEKDYRAEGGFVPIGGKEKADDVPARLSRNEFVFTADAVRNAGGGDVDRGAEVMENVMTNLEQGGSISEESQGLEGARDMFEVSERLSEVV